MVSYRVMLALGVLSVVGCGDGGRETRGPSVPAPQAGGPDWDTIRARGAPLVALPAEYGTPYPQLLAVAGWEDGIHITRDGLNLYCIYIPADLFSFRHVGTNNPSHLTRFQRGPDFGMDLHSNPAGVDGWLHGDILYSHRERLDEPFPPWELSRLARPTWSEGAPCPLVRGDNDVDLFVYTSNQEKPYSGDIVVIRDTTLNPAGVGTPLPAPVTTTAVEDNPHIERLSADDLVVFFDSPDRPGGSGRLDLWYTTSTNDGASWTMPTPVTSINTPDDEQQPHLYRDAAGRWFLYYTGTNATKDKVEIYRARLRRHGDWDSWSERELVIGAGNLVAVGEPTLTRYGDISFVAISEAPDGATATNRYDADPWFLPRNGSPAAAQSAQ